MEKVNLARKLSLFQDRWSPKVVGELNGQHVKLAKLEGEFVWHRHEQEDELFLVLQGSLAIHFRDREVRLQAARFVGAIHFPDRAQRQQREARDALKVAFADDDAEVRRHAIASLVRLGLEGEEPWLRVLALDDDPAVRVDAAGALRLFGR